MRVRSRKNGCLSSAVLLVALAAVLIAAGPVRAESSDTTDQYWSQLSILEGCVGPSLNHADAHASASVLAVRGTCWGILGLELHLYEFIRPGGATQRDKHSFLPVYVHFAPWIWRTQNPGREGGTRTSVLCFFAGGSAWAYRTDNPAPKADDEPYEWDWGHQYFRAGARYIRELEAGSLGVECGVVLSSPDEGSDVDAVSSYLALQLCAGLVE